VNRPDLRAVALGAVAWGTALVALLEGRWVGPALVVGCVTVVAACVLRRAGVAVLGAVAVAVLCSCAIHRAVSLSSPVPSLAARHAGVTAVVAVRSDPVLRPGRFGARVRFDAMLLALSTRERHYRLHEPATVVVEGTVRPERGATVALHAVLGVGSGAGAPVLVVGRGPPRPVAGPGTGARWVNAVRAAIRTASAALPAGADALVPALVDGDEGAGGGTARFAEDFRIAGMTHLLAVSGTNLTIILGGLLVLARWSGVRARGLAVVGVLGVAAFVALAGPEPSVLRAAAMGLVAIAGLGRAGPGRGVRALGTAVLALILVDPQLAVSIGFGLSVVATAGILLLAPRLREALAAWMPRRVAEALAIPVAAQLACTPVVAAISGQVSLVAVAANLVVAPWVAPATVSGLVGGLVALVSVSAGRVVAAPAGWAGAVMIGVAERAAALPVPAVAWSSSVVGITALTVLCAVIALALPGILRRRGLALLGAALLALTMLVPVPTPGWPPRGWVLVACDVGQGDALVLRAGQGRAVVVDAGPDPRPVDRCLRRLGVREIPVLVLSHFHADHVDGLSGVLRGRRVGRIDVAPLPAPEAGRRAVLAAGRRDGIEVRVSRTGERTEVGDLVWTVLGPIRDHPTSDSPPNDDSLVLLVETAGLRILMLGDAENAAQGDLRRAWPGLRVDVLKVAHHGSARQDQTLVRGLGARLAVISVGRDNDYGHPAARTLDLVTSAGMRVERTDRDGDVAVVGGPGGAMATVVRGGGGAP
jgi:competence protein ComEC